MNIQNILIDFSTNSVECLFEDKLYNLDLMADVESLNTSFTEAYPIDFNRVSVQLTEDQHMCEPRLLCFKMTEDPRDMVSEIVPLLDIATNHQNLYNEFKSFRSKLEFELTNILSL